MARLKGEINVVELTAITKKCKDLYERIAKDRLDQEKLRIERAKVDAALQGDGGDY